MRFLRPCLASLALAAAPSSFAGAAEAHSFEEDAPKEVPADEFSILGELILLSDYRFRGVSYSLGKPVAQGMVTVVHESGFYGGAFASSIGNNPYYGAMEIDLFAGWTGSIAPGLAADLSVLYYYYPDAPSGASPKPHSFETAAKILGSFGAFEPSIGIWYAWEQAALGGRDNTYLFADLATRISGTPLSVRMHGGHTKGAYSLSASGKTMDWSLGLTADAGSGIQLGIEYIGIGGPRIRDVTDDTIMARISAQF
jgi:uncharacterized protein (TIGR02001 family)